MRKFITISPYQYGEQQVKEQKTEKTYTLTQKKTIINEDYYSISRFIAVDNDILNTPERDFYVYQFNFMTDGSTLYCIIVDEQTAENFIHAHTLSLMRGETKSEDFQKYFCGNK